MADASSYHRDHWVAVEPARLDRYRAMFRVSEANRGLWVDAFGAATGETVVDFGCGPGYVSVELAKQVGPAGHVHGVDLNEDLLAMARGVAAEAAVTDRTTFHHVTNGTIPLPDGSVDRVIFKSVLLYISDVQATMEEARRVLKPGGRVIAQDSDFWLTACTAYEPLEWRAFVDAVRGAFADPTIGRNLRRALRAVGFDDVRTTVTPFVDDKGFFRATLENFIGYGVELGTIDAQAAEAMRQRADGAIAAGDWLFVLNFFQCEGVRSP